ncbi:MAG TPA: hypothetical protein VFV63_18680 [Ilumatobacteraceae bacterium]|nr:hypothetical protein [Ilumatobacteraceae bacterium]
MAYVKAVPSFLMHHQVVLGAQIAVAEPQPVEPLWHGRLDDGEVLVEREVLEQRPRDEVGHTGTHLRFGEHDVMTADAFEDPAVGRRDRFRPDIGNTQVHERGGGQHARLDVSADAHHGRHNVCGPELPKGTEAS